MLWAWRNARRVTWRWVTRCGWRSSMSSPHPIGHRSSCAIASDWSRTCSLTTSTYWNAWASSSGHARVATGVAATSISCADSLEGLVPARRFQPGSAVHLHGELGAVAVGGCVVAPGHGRAAASAGTHPADRVHPGAVAAAKRAGLDLTSATPHDLNEIESFPPLVISVCDRAHEELGTDVDWLHWSIPDPVPQGTRAAFDTALGELRDRIDSLVDTTGGTR